MRGFGKLLGVVVVAAALTASGCESDDGGGDAKKVTGTVKLLFTCAKKNVHESPDLKAKLKGNIYGNIFPAEDVGMTGPNEGAQGLADITVADLSLEGTGTVGGTWTGALPMRDDAPDQPRKFKFLGFFDIDGNGATSKDPDKGDPVTLPWETEFEVKPDATTEYTVSFGLLRP